MINISNEGAMQTLSKVNQLAVARNLIELGIVKNINIKTSR